MVTEVLKIVILQDNAADAALIQRQLRKGNYKCQYRVIASRAEYELALNDFGPDVILSDNEIQHFTASAALQMLQQSKQLIPFIIVTGTPSEEFAGGIIKAGADDYVLLDHLARLPVAMEAALYKKNAERARGEALIALKASEEKYRDIVENITDILCTHDLDGKVYSVNEAAKNQLGYEIADMLTMNIRDILSPRVKNEFGSYIHFIKANGFYKGLMSVQTKAGEERIWEVNNSLKISATAKPLVRGFARDVTERINAEKKLAASEKRYRALVEKNKDVILLLDETFKVTYRSPSATEVNGWTDEDVCEMNGIQNIHPDDMAYASEIIGNALANPGKSFSGSFRNLHKNGEYRWLEGVITNMLHDKDVAAIVLNFRDVTERKKSEDLILHEKEKFTKIATTSPGLIYSMRQDKHGVVSYPYASDAIKEIYGFSFEEIENAPEKIFALIHKDDIDFVMQSIKNTKTKMVPLKGEYRYHHPKKGLVWHDVNSLPVKEQDDAVVCHGIIIDITQRKNADELLKAEREKFTKIAATAPGLIYSFCMATDGSFSFPYASAAVEDVFGFKHIDIANNPERIFSRCNAVENAAIITSITQSAKTLQPWLCEFQYNHPVKGQIWLQGHSIPAKHTDNSIIWHGIINDVTGRKTAEQKIIKASRLYAFISKVNQMIIRISDEQKLFKEACNIAVEIGKFKMAWIGMVDERTNQVIPIENAGDEDGYLSGIKVISIKDVPEGRGPTGTAVREGKYVVCNNIESDEAMTRWKDAALSRGYRSSISIPIKKSGKTIGAFSLYAGEKNFFDADEIEMLVEATGNVSFALELFEKEKLRKIAEDSELESKKRYQTLTEEAPVGIFHTDASGFTTYVNPEWCAISGLSLDDALGNGWLNAVHEDDREALIKGWQNATYLKENASSEYRFVRSDGSLAWVIGQAIPEINSENKIEGYVGTITDITNLKLAETIIIREKQLSDSVINNMPGIFYLYSEDGKFIRWNHNFEKVTGYTGEEISTMQPLDFYDGEERERVGRRIKTVFEKNVPGVEVELFIKNKTKIPYYINSLSIIVEGKKCLLGMGLDLTERKKAEVELKGLNKKLEAILNALPDLMFEVGGDGHIYNFHSRSDNLLATQPDAFLGKTLTEVLPRHVATLCLEAIQEASATGISTGRQYALQLPQGETWFELSVAPMEKSADQDNHFIFLSRDITKNKLAETEIKKANERYELIGKATNDAVWDWNLETNQVWSNETHQQMYGLTLADPVPDFEQWKQHIHPEDRQMAVQIVEEARASLASSFVVEYRFSATNNTWIYILNRTFVVRDSDGKPIRFIGSMLDITESKKAETAIKKANERYELIGKATNDAVWDWNLETNQVWSNETHQQMYGLTLADPVPGFEQWKQHIHPEDRQMAVQIVEAALASLASSFVVEYRVLKANGEYAYVYDRGYIIRNADGKAIQLIGATQDISKLKENELNLLLLNRHLQAQTKALADSNAELEQFAYIASHDLQEPLRMVSSFLTLLEKKYGQEVDENGRRYIRFAVDGATRMRQIILDILEFSTVGRVKANKVVVNLNKLIQETTQLFQTEIKEKNAVIKTRDLPVLMAQESPLRQVFHNLIGNALKYAADNRPVVIEITATPGTDYWQFAVADNGIGINEEYFDKIFIIFQRLHNQSKFSGTGIGLAITKKIIENFGGKIWLESEPGKGSTFYFTIQNQ